MKLHFEQMSISFEPGGKAAMASLQLGQYAILAIAPEVSRFHKTPFDSMKAAGLMDSTRVQSDRFSFRSRSFSDSKRLISSCANARRSRATARVGTLARRSRIFVGLIIDLVV